MDAVEYLLDQWRLRGITPATRRQLWTEYQALRRARLDAVDKPKATAREIALIRLFGGKRRRGRVPRQIQPKPILVEYAKSLVALIRAARDAYQPILDRLQARTDARPRRAVSSPRGGDFSAEIKRAVSSPRGGDFSAEIKRAVSAGSPGDFGPKVKLEAREAQRLLDDAEQKLHGAVSTQAVSNLASRFEQRTSKYQKFQLDRQVKAAFGVDPILRDAPLGGAAENFVSYNVSLIKRIPKRLHEKIEGLVMNAVGNGELNVDLGEEIEKQFGIAERHARLIARDQISKYHGSLNRTRQEDMGVRRFIWRTVSDERVRDEHVELDGTEFSWDALPTNSRGEEIYPSSEVNCRCSAEPVLDDILDELNDLEDEPEIVPATEENV